MEDNMPAHDAGLTIKKWKLWRYARLTGHQICLTSRQSKECSGWCRIGYYVIRDSSKFEHLQLWLKYWRRCGQRTRFMKSIGRFPSSQRSWNNVFSTLVAIDKKPSIFSYLVFSIYIHFHQLRDLLGGCFFLDIFFSSPASIDFMWLSFLLSFFFIIWFLHVYLLR